MQLICGGKTLQNFSRFEFPNAFSFLFSANDKHSSNNKESLKLLDEIIKPYVISERKRKELGINHPDHLLMNVFRGQMTDLVLLKLRENIIFLVRVSPNMTNFFQPLDLTFLKRNIPSSTVGKFQKL